MMEVNIQRLGKEDFSIQFCMGETVAQLKQAIQGLRDEYRGIPISCIRLFLLDGEPLFDNKIVTDSYDLEGSSLQLRVNRELDPLQFPHNYSVQVKVQTLNGMKITIDARSTETVRGLKQNLHLQFFPEVPIPDMSLYFNRISMMDDVDIHSYIVDQTEFIVHLRFFNDPKPSLDPPGSITLTILQSWFIDERCTTITLPDVPITEPIINVKQRIQNHIFERNQSNIPEPFSLTFCGITLLDEYQTLTHYGIVDKGCRLTIMPKFLLPPPRLSIVKVSIPAWRSRHCLSEMDLSKTTIAGLKQRIRDEVAGINMGVEFEIQYNGRELVDIDDYGRTLTDYGVTPEVPLVEMLISTWPPPPPPPPPRIGGAN